MRTVVLFLFFSSFLNPVFTQGFLGINTDFKRIDIPFEYENNLIVVEVVFNKVFPLKFIFDTGAENTILAKKEFADILGIPYEREFKLMGADMKTELTAYLIRNIHLHTGELVMPRHSMLVLDDDYFRFEEVAGLEVHGILGADIFRNLVVKINFERKLITLTKRRHFKPPKDYESVPIEIVRSKPYLITNLNLKQDSTVKVKLLIDSGAMVTLLVNTNTHPDLHLPPNVLRGNLGAGLGGFIEGYIGRIKTLEFGSYQINEIVANFQEIDSMMDVSILNGRHGILGNQLLKKFHLIIDYPRETLYLKANRKFKKSIEFDKSGIVVIAASVHLDSYLIHEVIPGTPAAEAGLLRGDKIISINGWPQGFLTLGSINKILRKKEGKRIRMRIRRDGVKMVFSFKLRNLI